jgi:uncharacterized protein YaaW (UPF0174 family)
MEPSELRAIAEELGVKNINTLLTPESFFAAFQAVFRMGGFKSYQLTLIIVNAVLKVIIGRGLSLGGNVILVRTMAILTGPIGWVITALWAAMDIAGPAYRVTIPSVMIVSMLRQKYKLESV